MRIRVTKVLIAVVVASLYACVDTPTKPDESPSTTHVDIAYDQFVLSTNGTKPYDLSSLQKVPAECGAAPASPQAGGVGILATVATKLISAAASAIVNELKKWVDAQIAKYSSDVTGKPTRVGFYAPQRWFTKKDDTSARYSCFIITLHKCDAAHVDKEKGVCEKESADSRVLIVGQFKLTAEDLQIRPLFGQVRGFEATRSSAHEASIAATLKFESVWWDGHQGHTDAPMTANILSVKFKPTSGDAADPGINLPLQHKIPTQPGHPVEYAFADWASLPLLTRPPLSSGSEGTVSITPSIAETNTPPEALTLIKKVLGDNSSQISTALKNALLSLVPTK